MPLTPAGMPRAHRRRTVLAGLGLAAAALPLAACGIRLEDDAPRVPLIPTREPVPGEGFLLGLWLDSGDLAARATAAGGTPTGLPARLTALHGAQERVLRQVLLAQGVPGSVLADARRAHLGTTTATAPTTATPTPSSSPTTSAAGAGTPATPAAPTTSPAAALAEAEAGILASSWAASLARVSDAALPPAAAAIAQRAAAATLLGRQATWPETAWSGGALAGRLVEATRAAEYGFEVVAAQSDTSGRALAATTLAALRARDAEQSTLAGSSAPPRALGYPLPFAVVTPAAARRLAAHLLTGLRDSLGGDLAAAADISGALPPVVRWLAETEVLASRWGVPLEPFPGLS